MRCDEKERVREWIPAGGVSPPGEPQRSVSPNGYVRLTWKVGVRRYVCCYEHRHVMGHPDGEVHHINGDKTDNRPENLAVVTKWEHRHEHFTRYPWSEIATKYLAGMSTGELAAEYGADRSTVSRGIRRQGVVMRDGWVTRRL